MNALATQTLYYGIVMVLTIVVINIFFRGFFWKFIKVKTSLGRLIMIKIREVNYDDFAVGRIHEGFIVFKYQKEERRCPIPPNKKVFYRVLNTNWIDYDSEKNAFTVADYSTVSGFDAIKIQNFLKRILMMPEKDDTTTRLIIILNIVAIVMAIFLAVLLFTMMQKQDTIISMVGQIPTTSTTINPSGAV